MSIILEAKKVSKYFGGLKAVDEVDMSINSGEIFGIIGPNGAGKTTFFNMCSGVYSLTRGGIWLSNENITGMGSERIANKGLARTFQNIQLFKFMSVMENVKIGFHVHTKTNVLNAILHTSTYRKDEQFVNRRALEIVEQVGLSPYKDTMAGNLSYGIQRRVEIARALALDPKVLLLDEPAAGMNPNETRDLMLFIKKLNKDGYTIVVIEHDMKFVMNTCDRILVLNFGKKICEGNPDHVKNDPLVQEAYFGKGLLTKEADT